MKVPGSAYGSCGNTYCHSDGSGRTSNSAPGTVLPPTNDPRSLASNTSSTWGTLGPLGCNTCHGYPPSYAIDQPKANRHVNGYHNYVGCNVCHYATTTNGTSITNTAIHANGLYDIQPDPTATYSGTSVSFTYVYDPGGGYCNNVSCHGGWSVSWGYGGSGTVGIHQSAATNCYEVSLDAYYTPAPGNAGVVPISYYWTFGDGTVETQGSSPVLHTYAGPGPYTASVRGRDSKYHLYASTITQIWPAQTNSSPVVNETVIVDRYTVTLTDLSTDPDYNTCDHSGNGQIKVSWGTTGYVDTVPNASLSSLPTNTVIARTFSSSTSMNVVHSVTDNAGTTAGRVIQVNVPGPITISGTVRNSIGTAFSGVTVILKTIGGSALVTATTDSSGTYSLSRSWVDDCYLVQPLKTGYTFSPATQTICNNTNSANFQAN